MSSTRSIISAPPFAANALTTIPPTPVAGVSYRDPAAGPTSSPDGWPYAERVNSAEFNQIMYQSTSLLSIIDKKGVLGWSDLVDYTEPSVVFSSDGLLYLWILASGPANGGAKDPSGGLNPTYWKPVGSGQLIGIRIFATPGISVYNETPGTRSTLIKAQAGGGAGGGAAATGAGAISIGSGGTAGAYAEGYFTTGFSGASITVGAAGVPASGTNGGPGGTTSVGSLISCPGGGGGIRLGPAAAPLATGSPGGGTPTGGNLISAAGQAGFSCFAASNTIFLAGQGGSSMLGGGGTLNTGGSNGVSSPSRGAGGGGAAQGVSGAALSGGAGGAGQVVIWEFS